LAAAAIFNKYHNTFPSSQFAARNRHLPPNPAMSATETSHPDHPEDSQLLNVEQLQSLVTLGAADYFDLIGDVIGSVPGRISQIAAAIQEGNAKQLRADAHGLRGMLSYFGCEAMTRSLNFLELQPLPEPAAASAIQARLQALWQKTLDAIQKWEKSVPEFIS